MRTPRRPVDGARRSVGVGCGVRDLAAPPRQEQGAGAGPSAKAPLPLRHAPGAPLMLCPWPPALLLPLPSRQRGHMPPRPALRSSAQAAALKCGPFTPRSHPPLQHETAHHRDTQPPPRPTSTRCARRGPPACCCTNSPHAALGGHHPTTPCAHAHAGIPPPPPLILFSAPPPSPRGTLTVALGVAPDLAQHELVAHNVVVREVKLHCAAEQENRGQASGRAAQTFQACESRPAPQPRAQVWVVGSDEKTCSVCSPGESFTHCGNVSPRAPGRNRLLPVEGAPTRGAAGAGGASLRRAAAGTACRRSCRARRRGPARRTAGPPPTTGALRPHLGAQSPPSGPPGPRHPRHRLWVLSPPQALMEQQRPIAPLAGPPPLAGHPLHLRGTPPRRAPPACCLHAGVHAGQNRISS